MRRETSGSHAALRICGCEPHDTSNQRAQALFRSALKSGDIAIFETFFMSYSITVPSAAAIEIASLFTGKHRTSFKFVDQPVPFEGFYRAAAQGSDPKLFHQDSIDLEEDTTMRFEAGENRWLHAATNGFNPIQAMQVRTLHAPVQITLSGSLMDYYRFWLTAGPASYNRHPDTRNFALDIWTEIELSDPDFTAAAREVQRAS